jgi:ComF family protein
LCGTDSDAEFLCHDCADSLPVLPTPLHCPVCASRSPSGAVCGQCLKQSPHFDATHAVWTYEFPIDHLIHGLKYAHRISGIRFFAQAIAQHPVTRVPDLIVPVPLATARLRERGFNQSVEISRRLSKRIGVQLGLSQLRRTVDTSPQAALPWKERAANIRGAFECHADLSGHAILVIDDVMTTGATLNEVARTLKSHGAIWVENLVLARALKD